MTVKKIKLLLVITIFSIVCPGCGRAAPQKAIEEVKNTTAAREWTLRDYFNREWRSELVTYPVDSKIAVDKHLSLRSSDGVIHSYQWLQDGARKKIAFLADVPAGGANTYRLVSGAPQTRTDLIVEENAHSIRLYNNQTGVEVRKKLGEGEAPIARIRLASGRWIGNSTRLGAPALQSYAAQVVERGPVLSEVLCEAKFAEGKVWRLRLRLITGEPVVTVSESSTGGAGLSWRLRLDKDFSPTHVFRRDPLARAILTAPIALKNGPFLILEPWVQWSQTNHGNWQGFYNQESNDLLSLGALNPSLWIDVEKRRNKIPQSPPEVPLVYEDGKIYADFDLTGGARRWMISTLDKTRSLELLGGKDTVPAKTPLPHAYVIKYGDFPLDRVKDYVLEWPDVAEHPRLMINKEDIARLRRTYKVDSAKLAILREDAVITSEGAILTYLATGDKKIGQRLVPGVLQMMQAQVDSILKQENKGSLGAWPHGQQGINMAFNAADMVWPLFTPEERRRVKAQAALIGYTVNSPDYWSVERGLHGNPNMTTMVAGYQAVSGFLLADHPLHAQWTENGLREAKRQIEEWSDDNGGWLEAPHYANVSYDHILGLFLKARIQDGGKSLYHPKMQKVAEYFAKIATPPDVRLGGIRHAPRIGNTWLDEPSGLFGILAALWKDRDPKFASQMQWMYQQQGAWPDNGIGGGFPSFEGVRSVFLDPAIPAIKPDYTSTLFPKTGVSLRNGVDDRETQLYMIAGTNHEHYDDDSGSITLWGKGRVVVSEFAYANRPEMAARVHSLMEGNGRAPIMQVTNFKTTPHFDAVRGSAGNWQRQIAFVKDEGMMAPNYFVLRDSMKTPADATWRLWFDGKVNILNLQASAQGLLPQSIHIEGKDDVDTDIILMTNGGALLKTEEKSVTTFGLGANKLAEANRTFSLESLTATLAAGQDVLTVIYPRLKTQKSPRLTPLADGKALRIDHEAGTDYVFLNSTPFVYKDNGIEFEGSSGLVKIRGNKVFAVLGEGAKLTAR